MDIHHGKHSTLCSGSNTRSNRQVLDISLLNIYPGILLYAAVVVKCWADVSILLKNFLF